MQGPDALDRYLDLVRAIARSIHRAIDHTVELDELVSTGVVGLLEAASRADPERAERFRSYATLRVRGAILDGLGHTAALPRKSHRLVRAGRLRATSTPVDPRHLDRRPGPLGPEITELIDGRRAWAAVARLPERARVLLCALYADGRSLSDVADELGVSVSSLSRRHRRALARLRATFEDRCGEAA